MMVNGSRHLTPPLRAGLLGLAVLVAAAGCARNPVTGARQFMLISEAQEIRMGQDYDPQVIAEMGLYPDSAWQRYVRGLGEPMAAASERPHLPWTFRVVDDPMVNAFAVPGGFIYVTRGILAHFNSEAELAAVLGHEIGHVTARHTAARLSSAQLAQFGLALGTAFRPDLEGVTTAAGIGLGLLFLSYGRDDERQADDLGFRYMTDAGHDPREMTRVFDMLEAVSEAAGATRVPQWLATHPDPGNRRGRIQAQIAGAGDLSGTSVGRNSYLRRLDGMVFGANPREGFFRENLFLHPDLAFQFTFPRGWTTFNQKQAVVAVSPNEDALMQITLAAQSTPDEAAREFFGRSGINAGRIVRGTQNGMPAAGADFTVSTQNGDLAGTATFVGYGGRVYRLLSYSVAARWSAYASTVRSSLRTFDRLTDPAALAVQPLRIQIVTLDRSMTLSEFAQRYPSAVPVERLALINGVSADARLESGRLVKRVVGQPVS